MQRAEDKRIVMTLDAGGTNFVFSAMAMGREVVTPVRLSAQVQDIESCLDQIIAGFTSVKSQLAAAPVAISFAFPGPADYASGIIGDLGNLPCFKGGVALGPMLEDIFGIPTFINNDGDLFAYGEGEAGFLPYVNRLLKESLCSKSYHNLLAVTLGTGFGGGLYTHGRLFTGDNGAGCEIWCTKDPTGPYQPCEEKISIRAIRKNFAEASGIPFEKTPQPKDIYQIAMDGSDGLAVAAREAFAIMGRALGDVLADVINVVDGLIVVGGGLAGAHPLILPAAAARMNECYTMNGGHLVSRMESKCYNLQDPTDAQQFLQGGQRMIQVPRSSRTIPFDPQKRVAIGISQLGTSEAIAMGAYAFALNQLDGG